MDVLRTATVPAGERLTAWQDALRSWWAPVRVRARDGAPFEATLSAARFGYAAVLTADAGPCRISRPAPRHGPDTPERLSVALHRAGSGVFTQAGRHTPLEPGALLLVDHGLPFSLELHSRSAFDVLHLPLRAVGVSLPRLAGLTGRDVSVDGGTPALAATFVSRVAATADRLSDPVGERLAGVGADLLAALVDDLAPTGPGPEPHGGHPLAAAVRRHIEAHLGDPSLSPRRIAAALGVSVRYLHRVFEAEDTTLIRYVQLRRVEECARELARRRRAAPTISAVAHRWGFTSPAHFTRAFKSVYGLTPSQWREAADHADGLPPAAPLPRPRNGRPPQSMGRVNSNR
ncbi:AraC family transcriptional regulator [Streptomyces fumigatiscleroticus]|nr:AraC family transcriptional regulator [Streptomyces fumigatiscleroticus]